MMKKESLRWNVSYREDGSTVFVELKDDNAINPVIEINHNYSTNGISISLSLLETERLIQAFYKAMNKAVYGN